MKGEILWKEWVGLVAGGKVLGVASAARGFGRGGVEKEGKDEHGDIIEGDKKDGTDWVGDAKVYAQWLGKGVGVMAEKLGALAEDGGDKGVVDAGWKCLRRLFWKSFGLGVNYWGMLCPFCSPTDARSLYYQIRCPNVYTSFPRRG
ncbi:hypothetical protein EV426DRAFT_635633 [Tirmania nivea]|nr:hypothetical protein EV426DRAFT_635633 [Tirmania nivea]